MNLVALCCLGRPVIAQRLNTSVVEEDMKLALLRGESIDGCLDRGQVAEVQKLEDQRAHGLRSNLFDVRDGPVGLVLRTGSDVDLRVFGIQSLSYFLADTCVGASDNVDLEKK